MRLQVVRDNIERYERLLQTERDPANCAILQSLLAEARAEETLLLEERKFEDGGKAVQDQARRWRMRAEEYRVVADAMTNDSARQTYLRLAQNYEGLADRAEQRAAGRSRPLPKAE
jgi:hypothetical protein